MLDLYILEDQPEQLANIKHELATAIMIEDYSAQIRMATANPNEITQALAINGYADSLFFLDIEIDSAVGNGIDLAQSIRQHTHTADIIFITSHPDAALKIVNHQITPLDLISKGSAPSTFRQQLRNDLAECIDRANDRKLHSPQLLSYMIGTDIRTVDLTNVFSIQTVPGDPGMLLLQADKVDASFRGNLTDFEREYPSMFRCHKSALINPSQVTDFDVKKRLLTLHNGTQVQVSIRKIAQLKRLLLRKTADK
jgi:two-component system response regulator AgrA